MAPEDVERYRRSVDAWNRGALDEWLEPITLAWELATGGPFPDLATVYRGRQGALALWNALKTGPWDPDGGLPIERIEDRGETLLALLTMRARGAHSGTDLALKWAPMITRPGGEPAHPQLLTWREGLRAMGLPV
jgi:hypothetical protein